MAGSKGTAPQMGRSGESRLAPQPRWPPCGSEQARVRALRQHARQRDRPPVRAAPLPSPVRSPPEPASASSPARSVLAGVARRSEEHTSELQSLMRISYAVFCLKKTRGQHDHYATIHTHHSIKRQQKKLEAHKVHEGNAPSNRTQVE